MSVFDRDRPIEMPNRLADVADPCTEIYYPNWSSRGMRSVRCTRPAKATSARGGRKCGMHGKSDARSGFKVLWDHEIVVDEPAGDAVG